MKKPTLKFVCIALFSSTLWAQNTPPIKITGSINFNLKKSTLKPQDRYKHQAVSLFGCNTLITNQNSENWEKAPNGLEWNTSNQIFTNIPYGHQTDKNTQKTYFVSKYYIASPPVFLRDANGKPSDTTHYDIGIVTPHEFTFKGNTPTQKVSMDYDILKLMQIKYIPVVFDASFTSLGIDIVPFKAHAKDFPWFNNTEGASGIGSLNRQIPHLQKLFLPYYLDNVTTNQSKHFLDFEITILNDILLHHEIYFKVNDQETHSLNLKDFYVKNKSNKKMEITLYSKYRKELPCGCKEPE